MSSTNTGAACSACSASGSLPHVGTYVRKVCVAAAVRWFRAALKLKSKVPHSNSVWNLVLKALDVVIKACSPFIVRIRYLSAHEGSSLQPGAAAAAAKNTMLIMAAVTRSPALQASTFMSYLQLLAGLG